VDGFPVLNRGLESSIPGLHFLGKPAAWSFGPLLGFVSGAEFASNEFDSPHYSQKRKQLIRERFNPSRPKARVVHSARHTVGAVVIGGDYQGLGIVRSLGREECRFASWTMNIQSPDTRDTRSVCELARLARSA